MNFLGYARRILVGFFSLEYKVETFTVTPWKVFSAFCVLLVTLRAIGCG